MNILITSAGRRVSLVRSFQKELKRTHPNSKVYATDAEPMLSAACQVADGFFKVPKLNVTDYISVLINFCKKHRIRLIVPTIDTELLELAKNKSKFKKEGVEVVISSVEFVSKCRNKRMIHKFFEEYNVKVAKEYAKDNYSLPLFIKPIDGSRSVDTYIIKLEKDLKDYHFINKKLMFLEYLDHDDFDEFTCDLYFSKDNKLKCIVPRKRLEVRDGEVYKALTVSNSLVPYIKKNLSYIDGAVGCLTAQFFLHKNDDEKIYAIEINPRFGGGYPLSYLSGANFTKWIIEEYLLDQVIEEKFDVWESDLLMIRYDDEILVHGYKG
ncbi:ATP-grasp domain-containing protein [Winogradskyella thalassocola]|uniref:Carbamoyl-phosphate synthase large subunit n=1 Tax=Winogradskyella thalassocola TaxID=262004 RepID=A0A1G8DIT8_9FLAO|nr:ATP-grasp domain-containing protein [Winogradskyella thalassocola]SDH57586.1 carbamoyl-phosphate synthase large subunit [Winogradskyella thalassocola]